nr:hypothetical protein [Tanacetum cinerariifolium]
MNGKTYRYMFCSELGVPLFSVLKSCSACSRIFTGDIYADHVVSCADIVVINIGITPLSTSVLGPGFRPVRKLISSMMEVVTNPYVQWICYSTRRQRAGCVDLTRSSPLTQTGMVDFMVGRAVTDATHRKRVKYETKCSDIGYGFLLFSFFSLGEFKKDAVALVKRINKFSVTQVIEARPTAHIFNRISFAISKGVWIR